MTKPSNQTPNAGPATEPQEKKLLTMASRRTVERRAKALDRRQVMLAKYGAEATRKHFRQTGMFEFPEEPFAVVEMDATESDLIILSEDDNLPIGRFTITWLICLATRLFGGIYLSWEPESHLTYLECLFHALFPKPDVQQRYGTVHPWLIFGVPLEVRVDNHKAVKNPHFKASCHELGIGLEYAKPQTPEAKEAVERATRTIKEELMQKYPGGIFGELRRRRTIDTIRKSQLWLSEIERALYIEILDIYAQRFHEGLQAIPAHYFQAWLDAGWQSRKPPSAEYARIALGRTLHHRVYKSGINFKRIQYNCDELGDVRDILGTQKARVKVHPADLSRIYVFHPTLKRYLVVPAKNQSYTRGLSLWQHKVIRHAALLNKRGMDDAALGRAKRQLWKIVNDARGRQLQLRTRRRLARFKNAGKTPSLKGLQPVGILDTLPNPDVSGTSLGTPSIEPSPTYGLPLPPRRSTAL